MHKSISPSTKTPIAVGTAYASATIGNKEIEMNMYTHESILSSLAAEQIPAHVEQLKAHLASRKAAHVRLVGGCKSSNSKVMNQRKREIARFEVAS
jgi:hypothetical protein